MSKKIAIAYVEFSQKYGGKRRPIFIIYETKEALHFFDITSKYKNKSVGMKYWYFDIEDYAPTGLRKQSWIDTYRAYDLLKNSCKIHYIGSLSDRDTTRFRKFLSRRRNAQRTR